MHVAILNTFLQGGAARSAHRLHAGLRRIGVESTFLLVDRVTDDPSYQTMIFDLAGESRQILNRFVDVQTRLRENRTSVSNTLFSLPVPGFDVSIHPAVQGADVINLHWVSCLISPDSVQALQRLGKPIVWTLHDQRPFTGGCHFSGECTGYENGCFGCPQVNAAAQTFASAGLQRSLDMIDGSRIVVVSPSRYLAEKARKSALFRNSRIEVIPYGLDVDVFKPVPRAAAREVFGLDPSAFYFLFGAADIKEQRKGFSVFFDAVALCRKEQDFEDAIQSGRVRFFSFGCGGTWYDDILSAFTDLGNVGPDSKLAAMFSAANAFICPTLDDNLPNTVMESLSCGTPVIGSRAAGVPDMVADERNGLLVEAGSPEALAAAMLRAIRQPAFLEELGKEARKTAVEKFSLEIQASRYRELYAELASTQSAARDQDPRAWALQAFDAAREFMAKGLLNEAMAKINEALDLDPSPASASVAEEIMKQMPMPGSGTVEPSAPEPVVSEDVPPPPDQSEALRQALELLSANRLDEAEDLYRQILAVDPRNAEAWHFLGVLAHQCGKHQVAVQFIGQAVELAPKNAAWWSNLGEAWLGGGNVEKAVECGQKALELKPDLVPAIVNLGRALWKADRKREAVKMLERALDLDPNYCEGLVEYGKALHSAGRFKDAIHILKMACKADSSSFDAWYNLALAYIAADSKAEAAECFEHASKLNPDAGQVWSQWGYLSGFLGDYQKGAKLLKEALRCEPDNADFLYKYAILLQYSGRSVEALSYYDKAIEKGMNTADLHNNRGVLLKDQWKMYEAAEAFHRAISLNPNSDSALNNLGAVCLEIGLTAEALQCFELLDKRTPGMADVQNNLGKLLKDSGRVAEGLVYLKRGLELRPDAPANQSNFLYSLAYVAGRDPVENFNLHREWGERTAKKIPVKYDHSERIRAPKKKLRVGYLSPDFIKHPVAFFTEPLFANHDREKFEVYVYSDTKRPDATTKRLEEMPVIWRNIADLTDAEVAQAVWDDEIDLLINLSGHTGLNRMEMYALKPAPAQVSYLGYPATTGLATVGYRITDSWADPVGMTEHLYTEKLVRLPVSAWCYPPPPGSPEVGPLPSIEKGYITFASFNNIAKLNPELLELWVRILQQVPDSRLRMKSLTLHEPTIQKYFTDFFVTRGIDAARLDLSGFVMTREGHLGEFNRVDIALDSFPYHGTTTTCDCLWMGVPVVTRAGETHVSRVSLSLLNAVGHPELTADSPDAYVNIAVNLAKDQARLAALRAELRPRMQASSLMDPVGFTAAMEAAYREIWEDVKNHF